MPLLFWRVKALMGETQLRPNNHDISSSTEMVQLPRAHIGHVFLQIQIQPSACEEINRQDTEPSLNDTWKYLHLAQERNHFTLPKVRSAFIEDARMSYPCSKYIQFWSQYKSLERGNFCYFKKIFTGLQAVSKRVSRHQSKGSKSLGPSWKLSNVICTYCRHFKEITGLMPGNIYAIFCGLRL